MQNHQTTQLLGACAEGNFVLLRMREVHLFLLISAEISGELIFQLLSSYLGSLKSEHLKMSDIWIVFFRRNPSF